MIDQMSFESAVYVVPCCERSDARKMVERSNCDAMRQKMPDFPERFDPCYDSGYCSRYSQYFEANTVSQREWTLQPSFRIRRSTARRTPGAATLRPLTSMFNNLIERPREQAMDFSTPNSVTSLKYHVQRVSWELLVAHSDPAKQTS